MELVGDPSGLSVLDVACGEGFYTRMIRKRGAATITGIDLSEGMVVLARQQENRFQQGIEYQIKDARQLNSQIQYDLVVAAYLLNYSQTTEELQLMCDGLAQCLKPGGRFVTVNSNPAHDFSTAPSYRKYGFDTDVKGPWVLGAPIQWRFFLEDGCFEIENYYLDVSSHEQAFKKAGFRDVRWHSPQLSPQASSSPGTEFWDTFLRASPIALIECVK